VVLPSDNSFAMLNEEHWIEGLCKDVCNLLCCCNSMNGNKPSSYMFLEVMVLDVEVFRAWGIFGTFANSSAPVLSSKSRQCTLDLVVPILIPILTASFMRLVMGITSHNACDRAMYSASVELRAISVWSFDAQMMGHPAYKIT